jgi:hypothetical protein
MSNVRSYHGTESLPTCGQIDRACRILESHESPTEFVAAFGNELTPEAAFLAFHAGRAAFEVNSRLFDVMGKWKGERGDRRKDERRR